MWPSPSTLRADAALQPSPRLILRISLAEAGLSSPGHPDRQSPGVSRQALLQAAHQGERLLRTSRVVLREHALIHGEHCSLWVAEDQDMVAMLCEQPQGRAIAGAGELVPGGRWPRSECALGLVHPGASDRMATSQPQPVSVPASTSQPGSKVFSGFVEDLGPLGILVTSSVAWNGMPFILATIDGSAAGEPAGECGALGNAQVLRHRALSDCLSWAIDAVLR